MNLPRSFVTVFDTIDAKHRDEPDLDARDWRFVDEEEAELHGDYLYPDDEA